MDLIINIITFIANSISKVIYFNVLSLFGVSSIELPFVIAFLLAGYVILMFKLNFIQFTRLKFSLKYAFGIGAKKKKGEISSFKALLTSVASCTGMNAVAGMVFMVSVGGPGTVFWMPILAFLCMPFRFAEVYLSHSFRSQRKGELLGGPFDYIEKGLKNLKKEKLGKILSKTYALIMVFCGVCGLAMYETNQCVSVIAGSFSFLSDKKPLISFIAIIILAFILLGGTKRVMNFFSIVLPVIAIIYIFVSLLVIFYNIDKLADCILLIVKDAFQPRSIAGGFLASLCMTARKTSLAHETGLGTSGIVHASSSEQDSIKEATSAMMTPLINCFCVCLMSSLVLIITGFYNDESAKSGSVAIFNAFGSVSSFLPYVITILVPMLAFNVLIGWSSYVVKCSKFCFKSNIAIKIVIVLFLISAFIGGNVDDFNLIMLLIDSIMMFLIFLNVPIVVLLSGKVKEAIKKYTFK